MIIPGLKRDVSKKRIKKCIKTTEKYVAMEQSQ